MLETAPMITRTLMLVTLGFTLSVGCGGDDDDVAGTGGTSGSAGKGSSGKGGAGSSGKGTGGSSGKGTGGSSGKGGSSNAGETGDAGTGTDAGAPNGGGGSELCEEGCVLTLEADCPAGPQTQDQCVSDCERLSAGDCADVYAAFQACSEGEEITCDPNVGFPTVEACSDEQGAFIACISAQ